MNELNSDFTEKLSIARYHQPNILLTRIVCPATALCGGGSGLGATTINLTIPQMKEWSHLSRMV